MSKRQLQCVARLRDISGDCWAHSRAQPLRVVRYVARLRLSKFVPGKFVDDVGSMP